MAYHWQLRALLRVRSGRLQHPRSWMACLATLSVHLEIARMSEDLPNMLPARPQKDTLLSLLEQDAFRRALSSDI